MKQITRTPVEAIVQYVVVKHTLRVSTEDGEVSGEAAPELAPTTTNASRPDSHITFRVKGIPKGHDRDKVEELVRAALNVDKQTSVFVRSVAADPYQPAALVATLSFQKVPEEISSYNWKGEWYVPMPRNLGYPSDQHLFLDTKFNGFTPLYTCDEEDCTMDLIAVTGLNGHAFGSFKQKDGAYMWLRDSLPDDLRGTRILIWGYDTELAGSSSFQTIKDIGNRFSNAIRTVRAPTDDSNTRLERPLVLIGHSLGGIVVKEAIVSMPKGDSWEQANLQSVLGILFFGVPNQGLNVRHLRGMVKGQPNQALLDQCSESNDFLYHQNRKFLEVFSSKDTEILSFYETKESPTPREHDGRWTMSTDPKDRSILLNRSSALCNRDWERNIEQYAHPINRTHSDMVKFKGPHDEDYHEVRLQLQRFQNKVVEFKKTRGLFSKSFTPEQQASLESLAFVEQEWREHDIHTAQNTCHWLLTHDNYRAWMARDQGLLWLKGHPGSGKSTLMKYAWRAQERASEESGDVVAAFFFHGRGEPIQRTKLGLFRSLLNQILPGFPEILQRFTEIHQEHIQERGQKWKWGENELRDFFADYLPEASKARSIIIFVDALDEAGRSADAQVADFFVRLVSSAELRGGKLKVCLSSRHYPGLINLRLGHAPSISVDKENGDDIRVAVRNHLKDVDGEVQERQMLEREIVSRANGTFLWAMLVTEGVRQRWMARENFDVIRESIKETPDDLHNLYADILEETRPEERPQTLKLLQWVCFADRPLSTLELQHALALDADMTYTKVKHYRKDDKRFPNNLAHMPGVIRKLSKGLVEVVEHNNAKQAQFIHQAVKDYLLEGGLAQLALSPRGKETPSNSKATTAAKAAQQANGLFQISRSCIKYLRLKDIRKHVNEPSSPTASDLPLASYALASLKPHLRALEAEGVDQSDLLSLLAFPDADHHILATWHALAEQISTQTSSAVIERDTRLLHLLAECGVVSALRPALAILSKDHNRENGSSSSSSSTIDATDALGRTPLAYAARKGHVEVVRMLLEYGARLTTTTHHHPSDDELPTMSTGARMVDNEQSLATTPLAEAVRNGNAEVEAILREAGAEW